MDIWSWVHECEESLREQGEHRVADIIDELPSAVVNDDFVRADGLYREGLTHARRLKHRWLEVFFRHWNLQSKVLKQQDVKGMKKEAVSLLDFAHQEQTKDCPQSVCVVQDLAPLLRLDRRAGVQPRAHRRVPRNIGTNRPQLALLHMHRVRIGGGHAGRGALPGKPSKKSNCVIRRLINIKDQESKTLT